MGSWADEYAKLRNQNDVEEVEIFYGGGTKTVKPKTSTKKKKKNSFAEEYTQLRNERLTEEKKDRGTVGKISSKSKKLTSAKKKDRTWFNTELFDDGYQFGDVTKAILGTVADVGENIGAGIIGMGEKAIDAMAYIAPMAENAQFYQNGGIYTLEQQKAHEEAVEQSKSELQKFIQKDLYDEEKVARAIITDPFHKVTGINAEGTSVFGEKSDALIQSGGQLLGTMGLQAVGVPWFLTTGATSFGSEAENALKEGATYEEAGMSATISAGAEILSEKLSGGISFGGKTLDDAATKFLARKVANKAGRTFLKLVGDAAGEGLEEVFSQVMSNLGSALYKEESIKELLTSEEAMDEYLESFVGGAVLGGVSSGFKAATSKTDYVTELTKNEQKVVDKVYKDRIAEQKPKTEKEKAKIYDQVLRDLEKGYISTDTIEEVLGDRSGYDSLMQESEEYKTLYETESGKLSEKQRDRLAELKEKNRVNPYDTALKTAKSQLSDSVFGLVQSDRLAESYNERSRRGQTFDADLSQYDAKQQSVIQKAIDSGILNNTNRTHEFVDMVAKISADKGVLFDFTNNAKLKDSGFAVDGKMVNGYVTKDGVTVNIDSAKSMNSIVGHEITHVLEGTEFYDALQNTVIEYAKAKGDYQGRYDSLSKLYANIQDANVDNELTADLVGDYLFTDSDFIQKLSTEHRNVFQKIYDEIKYLYKVATAGSKEARQLEKVKREFERAYRESGEITPEDREFSDADTKYSIREEAPPKKTIEGYKVFMVKDGKLYPPMVANPEGEGTPVGVWLNADVGGLAYDADGNVQLNTKGRFKVKAGGKGTQGGGGELAFRPGWHLGEYPDASQFGRENKERLVPNKKGEMVHPKELFPYDFVWARCEVAADHDYQLDAMSFGVNKKGKFERSQAGLPYIPEDGYYKYRTNANPDTAPWIISGAIKVVEILDDDQVARICAEHGVTPQQRQGYEVGAKSVKGTAKPGNKIDLSMFGLKAGQVTPTAAEVLEQIRLTEGTAAERKAKAMEILKTLPGYAKRQIDFDDANIIKEFGMNNQNVDDYRRMAEESGHGYLADDKIYSDKPKYSISDSDGKKLTKEQQEYFKDSKMRDEDGNLKVMYHGSQDAGFHVFDPNMSDDGTSFFFVDRNDVASTYSGTSETYEARTIRTAADMNNFLAEIGYDHYEAVEKNGKFELLEDGDHVAWSDTAKGIYEEFCWYEGVGEGDANYKVYLNLKNPLEVDAKGRNWNNVSREYSQEVADRYHSLTAEEKFALTDIAGWGEISIFRDEIKNATDGALASAYQKMGDVNMYDLFTIAEDNFSEESIKQFAVKQMNTRDYAQKAKDGGYDGVIFKNIIDNGGYSNGSEGASMVAIAFESNQIKSVANEKPTEDADIRYSLSSIANTFFGDENMTSSEFKKMDYRETQGYKDYVDQCLNNYKQTRKDFDANVAKQEIEESIKGIVDVAIAAKTAGYDIQDTAMRRNAKDSKKRLLFSSLEPNSEYLTSHDISTICDKRKNFADIYDEIVKAEERKGVPQNKRFFSNVDNYFYLHKLMADKGLTQPCRQCYVESMRKNLAPMANAFLRLAGETNPNNTLNDQLYHQKGKQKGELKTNNAATREWVLEKLAEYDMSVSDLTVEKLTTEDGLAQLKLQAPLIYEAFNSFYGQSKPKMPKSATPFRFGELTALLTDEKGNIKKSLIDKINSTGGFRLQSYSDFQIQNYTDVLQVLFEAGTLGLNGHAYTKVPAFLDATAGTNLKRNISIFMYKDGDKWRLDRNDSFPYTLEQIYDIVKADKSGNTGIIAVSQNADMSAWIMANDLVGYGIPFHKSGLKMGTVRDTIVREDGREIKGYTGTKDHTKQQTEVWAKTADDHKALTKVKKGINIYSFWDFDNKANLSKNDLIEKNVKAYIDACEMAGYLPKFREYVMNNGKVLNDVLKYSKELGYASQDATIDDISFEYKGYRIPYGYYKFLGDFGMFTPDGMASPQATLSLKDYDFDKAVKFFSDAETLRRNEILQQFSNGAERQKYRDSNLSAEELQEIVKRKRKDIAQSVVDLAPAMSLSEEGETPKQYGNYNVSGKDIALETAPIIEKPVATDSTTAPEVVTTDSTTEPVSKADMFPDDLAPAPAELERLMAEEEDIRGAMEAYAAVGDIESVNKLIPEHEALKERISELQQSEAERAGSLTDADAPPEEDARFPGNPNEEYVENPFEDRDWYDMKNRSVKAYMYENPEVKPFFQEEAMNLLGEMNDGNQAERWYNDELHYASGGEKGFGGIKRHMPKDIEEMLDSWHMSYDDIRKGLNAIIEDNGAENIAAAKKIEFMLNRRLLQGYESFYTKKRVPPNDAYLDLLYEKQINEYSEEAFAKFMENADQYAPVAATSEDNLTTTEESTAVENIAPVATETVRTDSVKGVINGQETFITTEDKLNRRRPMPGTENVAPGTYAFPGAPVAEKYEAIKPKPNARPRAEPKMVRADSKGKQRKWVGTSTESEVVDRKVLPEDLNQDLIHYQPISNKKTLGNANAKLDSMGYESSVTYLEAQFANNKVTLDDIALGERLIQEAIKKGDTKTAGDLIMDISILGTELGQKVQALSIIKRLTPEGQLRMLQKTIQRGKTKGDKAFEGVELTQKQKDKILSAYGKDGSYDQAYLTAMVEDVKQEIADQMKVTTLEKVNAWRYLSMLGNPKTHIRNLVSNVAMRGTVAVKNAVARTIEDIAPIGNRTKTWKAATDDVKAFAQRKTLEMKDVISGDSKYSESASIKEKRAVFKNKVLNNIYEFNSDMLSKEDWWFSKPAFTNSLSEFLTANGIETEQDIKKNPKLVEKGINYALEQSQIATFRQYSWLANKINEIERKNTATNIAVGSILPFKKTPINIAKTGLSYSPLGFMKTLTSDVSQVKSGNMEASEMIDHLAQNLTGTALTIAGFMLASSGFLNGAGDDDKEGSYDYQLGKQAYSVNIGDATFSLSWLSPVAMPLFVGANAYEQLVEGKEWNGDVVVETLAQTLDPLSEMSFISSLDSVLSSYDSGIQKFAGIAETAAQNYITQFAPTFMGQVATVLDDTKRSTKVAADSDFKFVDETINKLKYKIPFLRETLEPSTDIWGNEINQTENVLERAFETFLAPYARRENIASAVDEEIKELYRQTGDTGLIPSIPYNNFSYDGDKYEMSAQEYTEFKKTYGQTAFDMMEQLFGTTTYRNADSETRADMVNRVFDYARDLARWEYLAEQGINFTNATKDGEEVYKENPIKGAIEADLPVDEYVFSTEYPEKYSFFKENGISYQTYSAADEEGKRAYTWAYENPGKFTMSKAIADDFMTYYKYKTDCGNFNAKDENGESVSGLKKERVIEYINNLDIDYGSKIILFRSMYDSKADKEAYNMDIVDYLNSRDDISYEEMETILKELGFEVDSEGNIRW